MVPHLHPLGRERLGHQGTPPGRRSAEQPADLQSAGLVLREPDPNDRRKNAVSLTDTGARLLERCEKAAREANDALLAPLSRAERDRFMDLLIRISGTQS